MIALWAHKNCTSGISFCNFPRSWAKCAWRIGMSYQSLLRFISIDNKIWSQHERFYRYYIMALLLHELKIYYENSRFPDSSSSSFYFSYFIYFLIRPTTGEGGDATRIYYIPHSHRWWWWWSSASLNKIHDGGLMNRVSSCSYCSDFLEQAAEDKKKLWQIFDIASYSLAKCEGNNIHINKSPIVARGQQQQQPQQLPSHSL